MVADISQRIVNDQIEPVENWDERGLEIKKDIWGRQPVPLETVPVPDLADGQGPIGAVPGRFPFVLTISTPRRRPIGRVPGSGSSSRQWVLATAFSDAGCRTHQSQGVKRRRKMSEVSRVERATPSA